MAIISQVASGMQMVLGNVSDAVAATTGLYQTTAKIDRFELGSNTGFWLARQSRIDV